MILPDLDELLALRGAAQGLTLGERRAALAQIQGGHRSAQRGRGLEVEEVRPYAVGDDARSIDWRVTARRGRLHTKLYREDRERPVWLLVDLHAGLYFGSRRQLKSALLLRTAALLGWAAVNGGDRLGAVLTSDTGAPLILPPRARQAGVLPLLEALVERQPRTPGTATTDGLDVALQTLQPLLRPGSTVLLLSDFGRFDERCELQLATIAARSDCRLLWLTDPLEASGLPRGQYRLGLPGRLWWLDGERSRQAWHAAWQARAQHLEATARRLNLPLTQLSTADAVSTTLPPLLRSVA